MLRTPTVEQRRFFETAAWTYQNDLAADTAAQAYLEGRGFNEQVAATFRLGIVRRPLPGHESYAGRLALPYLTPAGVVNMRFRCMRNHSCKEAGCSKYLSLPGMDSNLYNVLDLKKPGDVLCVAEGEPDTITLSVCGLPAVGVPGANAWADHWPRCLENFSKIYVFGDPDEAGRALNARLIKDVRAIPVRLPDGMDVNDLYQRQGADSVRSLLR